MNYFSVVELAPDVLEIKFIEPYTDALWYDISNTLEKLGAIRQFTEREGYGFEWCSGYKLYDKEFSFIQFLEKLSIDGVKDAIEKIENALLDSGLFEKIIAES
jgi:hypothetical protein